MDAKEWWSEREADRASAPVDAYLGTRSNYKREADVANDGDRTLLTAIAAGDETALREIHSRYYQRVASFSWRITGRYYLAEEVTNDTLLVIWQSAARFKAASKSLDLDPGHRLPHQPCDAPNHGSPMAEGRAAARSHRRHARVRS